MASEARPVPPSVPPGASRRPADPPPSAHGQSSDKQQHMQPTPQQLQQMPQKMLQQRFHQLQQHRQMLSKTQQQKQQPQKRPQQPSQLADTPKPKRKNPAHKRLDQLEPSSAQRTSPLPLPLPTTTSGDSQPSFSEHFSISSHVRPTAVFRSLNVEPDVADLTKDDFYPSEPSTRHHTPVSGAGTPKPVVSKPGTPKPGTPRSAPPTKSDLPICSNRGRAQFGECSWTPDKKDAATTGAASSASGPPPSPTSASPGTGGLGSGGGGSLRASMFKRPGALPPVPSTAAHKDSDSGTTKDGRPKPWKMETPPGIPHYIIPPPGRRYGGFTKGGRGGAATGQGQGASSAASGGPGQGRNAGGSKGSNSSTGGRLQQQPQQQQQKQTVVKYMDFSPWTGRHPEDRFTEATIRGGHCDRSNIGQSQGSETNSARGWLPALLKQKHSVAMLGQALALANVLSREKNHIAPASQFKLPPRVTVTDTRRETWLRDLTNPSVPLRKLSRTIPHGLRGKVLLEQCMLKNVPVDRAMWLARCVGAQELRAFKRKGTATSVNLVEAEVKWVKEWTLTAQQFLESFLVELDLEKATGQDRLQYAARFVRQLYLERLLDQDQFLNWMLAGLRTSAQLPAASPTTPHFNLWLFIVEEYFTDITLRRRTSCHLATTILSRLDYLSKYQTTLIASTQPRKLLDRMIHGYPEAFVCHSVWPRYETLLTNLLQQDELTAGALSLIRQRNEHLQSELPNIMELSLHKLQPLDDALRHPIDFDKHFSAFLTLKPQETVPFLIRWCASIHRPGLAKIYIAARLIKILCENDASRITNYVLDFLSSDRHKNGQTSTADGGARTKAVVRHGHEAQKDIMRQHKLHVLNDKQSEGNKAFYQLVGILISDMAFIPNHYLAALILSSQPSDQEDITPNGRPQVRLAAELPLYLLDQSTINLRTNHLRRFGYDADFEADGIANIIRQVELVFKAYSEVASSPDGNEFESTLPSDKSLAELARNISDRGRNGKMAVANWLDKHVVSPMADYKNALESSVLLGGVPSVKLMGTVAGASAAASAALNSSTPEANPANMALEKVNTIRTLIEKTDDMRLLSSFLLAVASHPQSIETMALCADTLSLYLCSFIAIGSARQLFDRIVGRSLAITIGMDGRATSDYQTLLPPGTEVRPLLMALPELVEKMPPPGPGSLVVGVDGQPLRLIPKDAAAGAVPDEAIEKHYETGTATAMEIQSRLIDMEHRLTIATYDADCSPVSDGRNPTGGQDDSAAEEVREEMSKIASSGIAVDDATMDRLFGTIAMISQEKWRRLLPENPQGRSRDDLRMSANLFARLRRFNAPHFDGIMVKWLKRLRTMRDRPLISTIYPVFIVFGCLDLASLMATTADEQPREPGAMAQSPARNTWRTGYLQDVLTLLSVPFVATHPMLTYDECQRFRLFQAETPLLAPASVAALVRNAVAEMTLWRHHQRLGNPSFTAPAGKKTIDALGVTRLLRAAALADATAAGHALARTSDPTVRHGLWEMMTLTLTREVQPSRSPLDMLRSLDIFGADVGQLALGLTVSSDPSPPLADRVKACDILSNLIFHAINEFQFSSLTVLCSLPDVMATSLKNLAQATFLDMIPTRKQPLPVDGTSLVQHFQVANGFLDVVRTMVLSQQTCKKESAQDIVSSAGGHATANTSANGGLSASGRMSALDSGVVDRLGELWCLLQESSRVPTTRDLQKRESTDAGNTNGSNEYLGSVKHAIIHDWLPALLSLILLHLPNRDAEMLGANNGPASQGTKATTNAIHSNVGTNLTANSHALAGNSTMHLSGPVHAKYRDLEQESVHAGTCIALVGLYMEVSPLAGTQVEENAEDNGCAALQSRLLDTAMLLADGLSDDTRQYCVRTLRDMASGNDLQHELSYVLSCPVTGSVSYPRLYLERLPSMSLLNRAPPSAARESSNGAVSAEGANAGAGAGPGQTAAPAPAPLKRTVSMAFGGQAGGDRSKRIRFGLKTWDAVSDPSPAVQDNDTAVNLWLLEATKVIRQRRR